MTELPVSLLTGPAPKVILTLGLNSPFILFLRFEKLFTIDFFSLRSSLFFRERPIAFSMVITCILSEVHAICGKFKVSESKNFYEEYKWQLKLKLKNEAYQRQFTLGCVGKIYPLEKPEWKQALKIY